MTEIFTAEIILVGASCSVSAMAMTASIIMLRPPKDDRPKVDLDAVIRDAPYHLLEGAGIKVAGAAPDKRRP